jgi:N-acetylglucosaminyldiphosphoundecaprenol N-acetyl-beta-D-mannosaminyltransferase
MSPPTETHTVNLLGVGIHALRLADVVALANKHIASREKLTIGIVNVAKVVNMQRNAQLRSSVEQADIILADGVPIVWLSHLLGQPLPERVAGIEVMFELLKEANERKHRVYFLGSRPEILQKVIDIVRTDYPGLCIAGYRDGYFHEREEQAVAEDITHSHADILFVAISSPKKEIFLRRWQHLLNVPVCHGVGGSFDVLAGATKRAPTWMQKCGLEWLFRLIQEPRRMWRRYLVTNSVFTALSLKAIIGARWQRLLNGRSIRPVIDAEDAEK